MFHTQLLMQLKTKPNEQEKGSHSSRAVRYEENLRCAIVAVINIAMLL